MIIFGMLHLKKYYLHKISFHSIQSIFLIFLMSQQHENAREKKKKNSKNDRKRERSPSPSSDSKRKKSSKKRSSVSPSPVSTLLFLLESFFTHHSYDILRYL